MNLHKLFKELQKLDYDDFDLLCDSWRESNNLKMYCERMGIKFKNEYLVSATKKRAQSNLSIQAPTSSPNATNATVSPSQRDKKIEQIILGDNLDAIEEAAKKKGLI